MAKSKEKTMKIVKVCGKSPFRAPVCLRTPDDKPDRTTEKVFVFENFKEQEVPQAYGEILMRFCCDIFKNLTDSPRKEVEERNDEANISSEMDMSEEGKSEEEIEAEIEEDIAKESEKPEEEREEVTRSNVPEGQPEVDQDTGKKKRATKRKSTRKK